MLAGLVFTLFQLILLIINWISVVLAKVSTVVLFIYVIVLIRRMFKTQTLVHPKGRAVLITGCDSGFGHKLALSLNSMGYRVYATVLSSASAHDLIQESLIKDQMVVWKMDVTLDEDVEEVYLKVKNDLQRHGCVLLAVVNNAGYGILAQLEWVDLAELKQLYEVNVFGTVRVTRAFLPLIRESKGRIVNICSQFGLIVANGWGAYCMSKWAVKAFTDALRREIYKFDVKVVTIYPGGFLGTNFVESTKKSVDRIWTKLEDSRKICYQDSYEEWKKWSISRVIKLSGDKIEPVVDCLVDAVTNTEPRKHYTPNTNPFGLIVIFMIRILPSFVTDYLDAY